MADETEDRVERALRAVLRPLADLMIAERITISTGTELLKQALYEAARGAGDTQPSDSQVSLLTGLHRKDVRRFREAAPVAQRSSFTNAASRLIALWTSDPDLQVDGAPRVLPRTGPDEPSFDALVARTRADLAPGTILLHLKEQRLVDEPAPGEVRLLSKAYLPVAGGPEIYDAFEKNLTAHLRAAVENMTGRGRAANFERASHFNRLSASSAAALEALAIALGEEHLQRFNAEATRLQRQDAPDPAATHRVSLGVYVIDQDIPKKGTPS